MNSQTLGMLLAILAVGTLVVVAVACSSQETDEPAQDDGSSVAQSTSSPQPESATPLQPEPSPEPTEAPVASSETQSKTDDPWGDDDDDPFRVTSVVENGRRYEVMTILPKDAIRAIFSPNFYTPEEAINQYRDTDLVIGVSIGDEHRAYNVAYLSGHEIVNDVVGGRPIAVTW